MGTHSVGEGRMRRIAVKEPTLVAMSVGIPLGISPSTSAWITCLFVIKLRIVKMAGMNMVVSL